MILRFLVMLPERAIYLSNGDIVPITNLFDEAGDDTDDFARCVRVVAGPMQNGRWIATLVNDDDRRIALVRH